MALGDGFRQGVGRFEIVQDLLAEWLPHSSSWSLLVSYGGGSEATLSADSVAATTMSLVDSTHVLISAFEGVVRRG